MLPGMKVYELPQTGLGPYFIHGHGYDGCLRHLPPEGPKQALTIRGDSYRLRAKRKSGLIKPPAADGPPVGSASLRPVSGGANLQPRS
ncbi:hypothetical protein ACVIGA_004669 [Bradyrhizobium sp. USDA 3240]